MLTSASSNRSDGSVPVPKPLWDMSFGRQIFQCGKQKETPQPPVRRHPLDEIFWPWNRLVGSCQIPCPEVRASCGVGLSPRLQQISRKTSIIAVVVIHQRLSAPLCSSRQLTHSTSSWDGTRPVGGTGAEIKLPRSPWRQVPTHHIFVLDDLTVG